MLPGNHDEATRANPLINIRGDKVGLGPLRQEDVALYHRWLNDFEVMRTTGGDRHPLSGTDWYSEWMKSDEHDVRFTVYELVTGNPIGMTRLMGIDRREGTAEYAIFIGEPDAQGHGYGTEATLLTLDYAFTALDLHNVMLQYEEYNEAARKAYERAGFREFGRRRGAVMVAGRRYDEVFMDAVAAEFNSPVLRKLLDPEARKRMHRE